ncbi:MAG: hypothetical protein JO301_02255 [Chitinophagaceae bacterium]|nr:hypothetical protein [Chitinophagaceae bacterium]
MPDHVHLLVAFSETRTPINTIVGNGKRFMAYELVKLLKQQGHADLLDQMAGWVNRTQQMEQKKHEVFEPSFDWKECISILYMRQKTEYMHQNPCKAGLCALPEQYPHSSARYYYTGVHAAYPVITYMELQDIDLTSLDSL